MGNGDDADFIAFEVSRKFGNPASAGLRGAHHHTRQGFIVVGTFNVVHLHVALLHLGWTEENLAWRPAGAKFPVHRSAGDVTGLLIRTRADSRDR